MEAGLPVSISGSGELSSSHNLHGFTTEVVPTNVALPFASSSSSSTASSSAFLPLVHKHSSKARTPSQPISTASPAVTVVRSAGLNLARNSESSVAVHRNTPNDEDARFGSLHNPLTNHRHSLLANTAHNYIGSLAVQTDSQRLKITPTDQTGNGLNSTLAGPHLQNGQHLLAGLGKRHSHGSEIEDRWHANDSGKQKLQRSSEGSKFKTDESKTRTNNVVKENNTHLKDNTSRVMDWHSGNKILSSETARPSVIAFGCPTSQKFAVSIQIF